MDRGWICGRDGEGMVMASWVSVNLMLQGCDFWYLSTDLDESIVAFERSIDFFGSVIRI